MLIGHKKIWHFLVKSFENNKLSHAFLFSGAEKLGKKTLVFEFVKKIFKADITKNQHPDFIFLEPGGGDSSSQEKKRINREEIHISKIRELVWKLSLTPSLVPFKVALIDRAHLMNSDAQSCLLKTLEEPKGNSVLFLISEYPEVLFSTIRSRCQVVKFFPVSKREIKEYLERKKINPKIADKIIEISQGKPGLVIDFLKNPQKLREKLEREKEMLKILNSDLTSRFQWIEKKAEGSVSLDGILRDWLFYLRKNLLLKIKKKESFSEIRKEMNRIKEVERLIFLLSFTNVNPRLALENLMINL